MSKNQCEKVYTIGSWGSYQTRENRAFSIPETPRIGRIRSWEEVVTVTWVGIRGPACGYPLFLLKSLSNSQ